MHSSAFAAIVSATARERPQTEKQNCFVCDTEINIWITVANNTSCIIMRIGRCSMALFSRIYFLVLFHSCCIVGPLGSTTMCYRMEMSAWTRVDMWINLWLRVIYNSIEWLAWSVSMTNNGDCHSVAWLLCQMTFVVRLRNGQEYIRVVLM